MRQFSVLGSLALSLFMAACSSTPNNYNDLPEWVRKSGGLYEDGGKSSLYAVGSSDKSPSMTMQRNLAMNNGRQELQSTMQTYVQRMISTYMRSAADRYNMGETASLIENNEDVGRSITQGAIVGAQAINSYQDQKDGTLYVLMKCELNNDFIKSYQEKAKAVMREQFAKYSKELKEDALGEMDKAIEGSVNQMKQEATPYQTAPTKK